MRQRRRKERFWFVKYFWLMVYLAVAIMLRTSFANALFLLVKIVPFLGRRQLHKVPLLEAIALKLGMVGNSQESIARVVFGNQQLALAPLNSIDLSPYSIGDLPGLDSVPLMSFVGWQQVVFSEIPNLSRVPLEQFPSPVVPVGSEVRSFAGITSSDEEVENTVSGVECTKGNCTSMKLESFKDSDTRYLVNGTFQEVAAGEGCFERGWEPVGFHPYGKLFKVVLTRVDANRASTALFFPLHRCDRSF